MKRGRRWAAAMLAVIVAVVIRLGRRRSLKLPGRTKQADKPEDKPPQT